MRRRSFLLGAGTAAVAGAAGYYRSRIVETTPDVRYPGMQAGHALRDGAALPQPSATRQHQVAILGAGVAGLSCAWKLAREGFTDFVVVQGPEFAGNAASGQRDGLDYPLGAHYLPLPSLASAHVRDMLAEFGIIERGAGDARPYYDETVLVHSPQERLLRNGQWEEGLLPMTGVSDADAAQHRKFLARIETLRTQVGADGRKLFCIPIALSSQDPAWRALDAITFKQWLEREGYTSAALHWYLNYCCRDDYGAEYDVVSAWAGLHYFASRDGHAANAGEGAVLTWPGGLAVLAQRMRESITRRLGHAGWLLPGAAARLREAPAGPQVTCLQSGPDGAASAYVLQTRRTVCAMPLFVAQRILPDIRAYGYDPHTHASAHAPWMVSNFVLDGYPAEAPGEPLSWDNVVYQGQALGYVVSTHQLLRVARSPRSVFTAYHALSRQTPQAAREWLTRASPQDLRDAAAADLVAAYGKEFWRHARQLEITVRGHAMASPLCGYLSNPGLAALRAVDGPVLFAHADLSGYSVFEEAAWWGVTAAERILGRQPAHG
ncbi:NAD(P)/FAD-dependent oxidoreductase [Achromobacter arsenitoxydans]|uniref:Twin-arginine translocation pathway signal 3 n=1 Tax=Achromobacter arsenitoxydans SY8 TaxID=477184 RepID=H0FEX9_9BURK|nr:NAD(P)/FAD-dependent oxidoreductase [Achromobacter arsenitoxydans]EHK63087.1 twin-arginine translocation pathway signal 3 [Achromobacter arsenitoxydans SY8]